MSRVTKSHVATARTAADAALDVLRNDPPRLKRLLRETAGLADDFAAVLEEADQHDIAKKLSRAAKLLRGGAILPAGLAVALLRKTLEKILDAAG